MDGEFLFWWSRLSSVVVRCEVRVFVRFWRGVGAVWMSSGNCEGCFGAEGGFEGLQIV